MIRRWWRYAMEGPTKAEDRRLREAFERSAKTERMTVLPPEPRLPSGSLRQWNIQREAAAIIRDFDLEPEASLPLAELLVRAYKAGERACTARLVAPDTADAIAKAIEVPESVVEKGRYTDNDTCWRVRAVLHVLAERGVSA